MDDDRLRNILENDVKPRFPNQGARALVTFLRKDYQLKIPEYVIQSMLFSCLKDRLGYVV